MEHFFDSYGIRVSRHPHDPTDMPECVVEIPTSIILHFQPELLAQYFFRIARENGILQHPAVVKDGATRIVLYGKKKSAKGEEGFKDVNGVFKDEYLIGGGERATAPQLILVSLFHKQCDDLLKQTGKS